MCKTHADHNGENNVCGGDYICWPQKENYDDTQQTGPISNKQIKVLPSLNLCFFFVLKVCASLKIKLTAGCRM